MGKISTLQNKIHNLYTIRLVIFVLADTFFDASRHCFSTQRRKGAEVLPDWEFPKTSPLTFGRARVPRKWLRCISCRGAEHAEAAQWDEGQQQRKSLRSRPKPLPAKRGGWLLRSPEGQWIKALAHKRTGSEKNFVSLRPLRWKIRWQAVQGFKRPEPENADLVTHKKRHSVGFVHILLVARILDDDRVVGDGVGIEPLSRLRHVPPLLLPAPQRRTTAKQRLLDATHIPNGLLSVPYQVLRIKGMPVLPCDIPVETLYAPRGGGPHFIPVLHLSNYKSS